MTLATRLEKIESSGLIRLAQRDPEVEYIFRHALVQDATYESLLKADRRILHQAVGCTLEALYSHRLDDIAATLGFHFERAEELEKAVGYYIRAGESAARIYAVDESIALFGHALEIISDSFPNETLTHLYSQYGRVLELAGRFDTVIQLYEEMRAEGVKRQDLRMELNALMARAILHSTPSPHNNFPLAFELCEQALVIARALKELEAQSRIYWILMIATLFDGRLPESVSYGEQSLAIARSINNPERLAFILNDITRCYASNGMIEKAQATNAEARALWKQLGNLPMLVDNLNTYSEYLFFGGEYVEGLSVALEAYQLAKSIQNVWGQTFSLMILGFAYTELGEIDHAIQANLELLSFDPRQTFMIAQLASLVQLAEIYMDFGDLERGYTYMAAAAEQANNLESASRLSSVLAGLARYKLVEENLVEAERLFEKALEKYDPENFTTFTPLYMERTRNDILMYKGQFVEALEVLEKNLLVLERLGIVFCVPELMLRKANALNSLGRQEEALSVLQGAASLCERIGSRRLLWKIYVQAGELQSACGRLADAQESQRKAREHLDFLLSHLPDSLRQSFSKLPAVAQLLGK
jgi:tetratricopeptide (TPR) repeat protein